MGRTRVAIWKVVDESKIAAWKKAWRERWGLWVAGAALACAVVLFVVRITPWLSDESLFWLKLISFFITAALGIVGVLSDFKDDDGRLTGAGKLNLTGLCLAAVIGIIAQKAEYENTTKASAEANKKLTALNGQNQAVLQEVQDVLKTSSTINLRTQRTLSQVDRNLEIVGDTIIVNYAAKLPLRDFPLKGTAEILRARMKELAVSDEYSDEHTFIELARKRADFESTGSGYYAAFDGQSILMPQNEFVNLSLSKILFSIAFYKVRPQVTDCRKSSNIGAVYEWDEALTATRSPSFQLGQTHLDNPMLAFNSSQDFVVQSSHFETVFKLRMNPGKMLSALDFSQTYMRAVPAVGSKIEFVRFVVQIGQHSFIVPVKQFVPDRCGSLTYRLPKIPSE